MRILNFLLALLLPAALASTVPLLPAQPVETAAASPVVVYDREVSPGGLLRALIYERPSGPPVGQVRVQLLDPAGNWLLEVPAFLLEQGGPVRVWMGILGLSSTLPAGEYQMRIDGYLDGPGAARAPAAPQRIGGHLEWPVEAFSFGYQGGLRVRLREFPTARIALNTQLTELRTRPDPRKEEESRALSEILHTMDPGSLFDTAAFILPLREARRTGGYGDRRVYEYSDGSTATTIHYGIDFGAAEGIPVQAPASAAVILARERLVTGYTVVLEHLPGLYSLYYHLSAMEVREGETVAAGRVIGRVGSTGLATGPHLHWEVRAGGVAVDPEWLIRGKLIDKTAISGMIEQILGPQSARGSSSPIDINQAKGGDLQ